MRLFVEKLCLQNFHYDTGCQGIEIYARIKFRFLQCFSVRYIHVHVLFITYCSRLVVVVFIVIYFEHDIVCRVTELHLSTKFHVRQFCG